MACLVEFLHDAYTDGGTQIDVAYSDFAKALDKVHLELLASKLQQVGVVGVICLRKNTMSMSGDISLIWLMFHRVSSKDLICVPYYS